MPDNNNVVTFSRPTVVPPTEEVMSEHRLLMYEAIQQAVDFLVEHRDSLQYFVLTTCDDRDPNAAGMYYNIFTSRISKADFCLATKMLEKSALENL